MPSLLAIVANTPPALQGRSIIGSSIAVDRYADPALAPQDSGNGSYDLVVISGFPADMQQKIAGLFQDDRRLRVIPVLYLTSPRAPGFVVPAAYRPGLDTIMRGNYGDHAVESRIRKMLRDVGPGPGLVVVGPLQLDTRQGHLRCGQDAIDLTPRETQLLAMLLDQPNHTVEAAELVERSWGTLADEQQLQVLRRHISNIRGKLRSHLPAVSLHTVRGQGYRIDLPFAMPGSRVS